MNFLSRYRSFFIHIPIAIIVFVVAIYGLNLLTGRSTQADVGALVDLLMAAMKCLVAYVLTSIVKGDPLVTRPAVIDANPQVTSWQEMAVTRLSTVLLIVAFLYGLSH